MALRKTEKANLRNKYPLFVEVGLFLTLVVLIVAFRLDMSVSEPVDFNTTEQEVVQMEEILQTTQIEKPPPPPPPPVPVEVPNDEVLDDVDLDLDMFLDIDEAPDLPPPPPPAEEEEDLEPEIFVLVEDMPELIGGMAGLQKRVKYPEMAKRANVEGKVFLQFIVDEQGNVVDPVVLRGIGAGCDEEALRAIREAKFKPGMQRGTPVQVKFNLAVTFRLR
jgi:protein TonB